MFKCMYPNLKEQLDGAALRPCRHQWVVSILL